MPEEWDRILSLGLGSLEATREKLEPLFREAVESGAIPPETARHLLSDFLEKGRASRKRLQSGIEETLSQLLEKQDFARTRDIERIEKKLDALLMLLEKRFPRREASSD